MDEMREIVTREQVERWFLMLALIAPVAGTALGALAGARKGFVKPGAVKGLLLGLLGPVNLLLWKVYDGITDRLGLDTVKNLAVNLALFIVLGIVGGLFAGSLFRRRNPPGPGSEERLSPVCAGAGPGRGSPGVSRQPEESEAVLRDQ